LPGVAEHGEEGVVGAGQAGLLVGVEDPQDVRLEQALGAGLALPQRLEQRTAAVEPAGRAASPLAKGMAALGFGQREQPFFSAARCMEGNIAKMKACVAARGL